MSLAWFGQLFLSWVALNVPVAIVRFVTSLDESECRPEWYDDVEPTRPTKDCGDSEYFISLVDTVFPLYSVTCAVCARVRNMVCVMSENTLLMSKKLQDHVFVFTTCVSIIVDARSSPSVQDRGPNAAIETPTRRRGIRAPSS